jgi:hypothetical protein
MFSIPTASTTSRDGFAMAAWLSRRRKITEGVSRRFVPQVSRRHPVGHELRDHATRRGASFIVCCFLEHRDHMRGLLLIAQGSVFGYVKEAAAELAKGEKGLLGSLAFE